MNKKVFHVLFFSVYVCLADEFLPSMNSFTPNNHKTVFTDIVGIMVDFAIDDNSETSGNGKFLRPFQENSSGEHEYIDNPSQEELDGYIHDITNYINYTSQSRCSNEDEFLLDRPSHDAGYFEQQLIALKSYYSSVSNGNNDFTFNTQGFLRVLPKTYTLDEPMSYYATSDDQIGLLFAEGLEKAEIDLYDYMDTNDLNYSTTLFVIFHAGLGQEASENFDPTIYDIKSAYVDIEMLDNVPDEYEVIDNLMDGSVFYGGIVMPETMNWIYYDVIEDIYPNDLFSYSELENLYCDIQLGMTGLFAYLVGYKYGFQPLHNIDNGTTRIGKFGLMDVGFYNWNGIIPARPSAWTRVRKGLNNYFDDITENIISNGQDDVYIEAIGQENDQINKMRISENEYFLIENRSNITTAGKSLECIIKEDSEYPPIDCRNEEGYEYVEDKDLYKNIFDVIKEYSPMFEYNQTYNVVTSVENYDIGLPGDISEGFLIWHINESNYNENSTGINNDINNKVVSLEEGDGINNIGNPNYLIFGDNSKGWRYDFWTYDNIIYKLINYGSEESTQQVKFNKTTSPNSKTDSGSDSFISMRIVDNNTLKVSYGNSFSNNYEYESKLIGDVDNEGLQVIGNDGFNCLYYIDSLYDIYRYCDSGDCTIANTDSDDCKIGVGTKNTRILYDYSEEPDYDEYDEECLHCIIEDVTTDFFISSLIPNGYYENTNSLGDVIDADALGDFDKDGYDEKIILNNGNLEVYNYSNHEVLSDGFPVYGDFFGYPLVSDLLDHDGNPEIICKNGDNISFISNQGQILHEIPLYNASADLYIIPNWENETSYALANGDMLYVFDHETYFNINDSYWLNPFSTYNYSAEVGGPDSREPLDNENQYGIDMSKAYNYPNPIKDGFTTFRFYVLNSLSVQIKIYDAAGFLVEELNNSGLLPDRYNEIRWNSSSLDSGLYFAEIKSDKNESKLIKVVVL